MYWNSPGHCTNSESLYCTATIDANPKTRWSMQRSYLLLILLQAIVWAASLLVSSSGHCLPKGHWGTTFTLPMLCCPGKCRIELSAFHVFGHPYKMFPGYCSTSTSQAYYQILSHCTLWTMQYMCSSRSPVWVSGAPATVFQWPLLPCHSPSLVNFFSIQAGWLCESRRAPLNCQRHPGGGVLCTGCQNHASHCMSPSDLSFTLSFSLCGSPILNEQSGFVANCDRTSEWVNWVRTSIGIAMRWVTLRKSLAFLLPECKKQFSLY